jgi:hypothetical protein
MNLMEINPKLIFQKEAIRIMNEVKNTFCRSLLRVPVFVVSTHRSKSCILPVYAFRLENGIKIIMRHDFHDWVLTIMSPTEISIPKDLVFGFQNNKNIPHQLCEGFKKEWVFEYKTEGFKNTTVYVDDNFKLYTLFYLLNKEVTVYGEKVSEIAKKELNSKALETIIDTYLKRHKEIRYFDELFPKTFSEITNYEFCQENNLPIFLSSNNEIYDRITSFDKLKNIFLNEKLSFDWGEDLEPYKERLNF